VTREEIIKYWLDSSDVDYRAMENLFHNRHYAWSLFIAHLVIEKLLKAIYVKNVSIACPKIHDLLQIAKKSNLELSEKQMDLLDEVTTFNIKARYPDYKNRFYKKATQQFTEHYILQVEELRQWLIQKIKS
jgi:HEPN domain-containing protein